MQMLRSGNQGKDKRYKVCCVGIKDMKDDSCDLQSTTAIPKSSLPERFVIHWCEKTRFCVCDLIGWEIEEGDNDPHMDT